MDKADAALNAGTYGAFKELLAASGCIRCGLSGGRTQIVVDRGNPEAGVLFIGEAPGEKEDLSGRAFVGRSGQLLDSMLRETGFDTERDALIVNVAKCRPPKNRAPSGEEAGACRPFLQKQIAMVRPRLIVLLGKTALKHILPEKKGFSMAGQAGRCFRHPDYPEAELMVLFHPAYILRDPRKKPLMAGHLKTLKEFWESHIKTGQNERAEKNENR